MTGYGSDLPVGVQHLEYLSMDLSKLGARTSAVERQLGTKANTTELVSALPSDPIDGQEIHFQSVDMATDGIVWTFRYRADSASAYKWERVGGDPWLATAVNGVEARAGTAYGSYPTPITRVTPLAGDYFVDITAWMGAAAVSSVQYHSFSVGGTGASDNDAIVHQQTSTAITTASSCARRVRKNAIVAATTLTDQVRATAGTANSGWRNMAIVPIRVG